MNRPLSGWIILDKPLGLGSTQAVSAVKRALREAGEAKTKVGHGGTLDPLATGVLPIALGEATKLAGRMLDAVKGYDFTIRFGSQTDTLDLEGKEIASSPNRPTLAGVAAALPAFTGPIGQVPPAYSALKVDGQRAYDLARAGEEVELKSRAVTIHALTTEETADGPLEEITLSATVSKGTYIRSLARDFALALGTVGHVTMLRRTKAGPFTLDQAIALDFLDQCAKGGSLDGALLPLQAGLDDIPAFPVTPDEARLLRFGQRLSRVPRASGLHVAVDGLTPVALIEGDRVVRGFNLQE
ncbi:tRNA pseudouridine55 synthase [Sphingomonas kaistensis]|uniref:tRNA pseudouridine synthase B n=1 Tax=Sphingomonas kaistensis TaxID=298708 RepID=A0A7X5Y981_9SPHN|nr:tRNA pseudouridine55 synthase [Sphingomonas kaistensis]